MVNLIDGYIYKILARLGLAAEVPTLDVGEIGWDTDKKTARFGDGTAIPPRVMSDKSTGSFDFGGVEQVRFARVDMVPGGKVDGVDVSTLNQTNGLVARTAPGEFANRKLVPGNDSISILNPDGVNGDIDIRVSDSLVATLMPPKFYVTSEEPQDAKVRDYWLDYDGEDNVEGNIDDGNIDDAILYMRTTNGIVEKWTQISNEYQNATETEVGLTRYATLPEALARVLNTVALTPRSITALIGAGNDYRTVLNATLTAPPASPSDLAAYLIPIGASGVWSTHVGKIATWDGADWVYDTLRVGAMVVDSNKSLDNSLRYLKQTAELTWSSLEASETELGLVERATEAEVQAGVDIKRYVTPAALKTNISYSARNLPMFPEVITSANGQYLLSVSPGVIVVNTNNWHVWRGMTLIKSEDYTLANRTFNTLANQTYHLRWYAPGSAQAVAAGKGVTGMYALESLSTPAYNPTSVSEASTLFDTTYDSMLIARVVTNGSNIATVTYLNNKDRLYTTFYSATTTPGSTLGMSFLTASRTLIYGATFSMTWSRYPRIIADMGCYVGYGLLNFTTSTEMGGGANNMTVSNISRYGFTVVNQTDFVDDLNISFAHDSVFGVNNMSIGA